MSDPLDPAMFTGCRSAEMPMRMNSKWAPKIMRCLIGGPRRYSELQVPLIGISPKVLAESLRSMERDGIVSRTAHPGMPPKVEYELGLPAIWDAGCGKWEVGKEGGMSFMFRCGERHLIFSIVGKKLIREVIK